MITLLVVRPVDELLATITLAAQHELLGELETMGGPPTTHGRASYHQQYQSEANGTTGSNLALRLAPCGASAAVSPA